MNIPTSSNIQLRYTFGPSFDGANELAWSPDGHIIASGVNEGTVNLWDVDTGKLRQTLKEQDAAIRSIVWSPDSSKLVALSDDGSIRMWDVVTGSVRLVFKDQGTPNRSVTWLPDGQNIISGASDGTIRFWDAPTGTLLHSIEGHRDSILCLTHSLDGQTLITGSDDGIIKLWNTTTRELQRALKEQNASIRSLALSPDGKILSSGADDSCVKLWNAETGTYLLNLVRHKDWIRNIKWTKDERSLLTLSEDGAIGFLDARTGKSHYSLVVQGGRPRSLAWSPDGDTIAVGIGDETIQLWDIYENKIRRTFKKYPYIISTVEWSADGRSLATGAEDGILRIRDAGSGGISRILKGHKGPIRLLAWSQSGKLIVSGADDQTVRVWDAQSGALRRVLKISNAINAIACSPDERKLAVASNAGAQFWDIDSGKSQGSIRNSICHTLTWSSNSQILALGLEEGISLWGIKEKKVLKTLNKASQVSLFDIDAWSKDSFTVVDKRKTSSVEAFRSPIEIQFENPPYYSTVRKPGESPFDLWRETNRRRYIRKSDPYRNKGVEINPLKINSFVSDQNQILFDEESKNSAVVIINSTPEAHNSNVYSLAFSPDGSVIASGTREGIIRLWNTKTGELKQTLEGHKDSINKIIWAAKGKLLISEAEDRTIRIWRSDDWETVKILDPQYPRRIPLGISLHSTQEISSTLCDGDILISNWELDVEVLLNTVSSVPSIQYASAKVVLVGESNVGKSCLALRLAQDHYEEQGTTHGMRVWHIAPEQITNNAPENYQGHRDIVLWDMGGQDEYRLIHQLFLHDTTLALILLDPTRGRTAFEEVEGWNLRLEKQLQGRKAVKLLVGTKVDKESSIIDQAGIQRLVKDCGFAGYYETSAKLSRGISELRETISGAINWEAITKTSRPVLFQRIRNEVERRQKEGDVVLHYSDLERLIKREDLEHFDTKAISIVVEQLSLQGLIVATRLASGDRVLVLQIGEIERYAGSLIIAARNNPRGVPAIEEQMITTGKLTFPGIKEEERLRPFQERIVLECVVQLLLEHGICMKHEGLLIFPSMFQPTERDGEVNLSHSISLYYDFSGAIENIYSSLVVRLAVSEQFGRFRLWEDRAEFERTGYGVCGLRKVIKRNGIAHLDLFFSDQISDEMRNLFTVFVEEHLRKEGVSITEVLEITCACGFNFQESSLRKRLSDGYADIICPECETRSRISEGAQKARASNSVVDEKLLALKTIIDKKNKEAVVAVKIAFNEAIQIRESKERIRILHISDLHISQDDDPISKLQPLIQDLEDPTGGLGFTTLDYLVISGDLTNSGTDKEFEQVYQIISELIDYYNLTAERCIIVPGNHDLNWEKEVYVWKQKRKVELKRLKDDSFIEQGGVVLIRDDSKYSARFEDFAKFYHSLTQQQYPLKSEDQYLSFLFEDTRIQFLALNSAWEIDEFYPERASINSTALSNGLISGDAQIKKAQESKRIPVETNVLRIAVWHHPVTGNEKIINDSFLDRLRQADFKLCLHGHVHETRADLVNYIHPTRKLHIIGAGSFGASAEQRPESTPRLYNVLEIERDLSNVRVHTRCLRKNGGAWEGWAVWPGSTPTELRTFYDIKLH